MNTSVLVSDWIKRIVDDERRRDTARVKEDELAAQKADLIRRNGRRLVDDLRQTVTRDAEAFRAEFAGDRSRDIVTEATSDGGFVVRKPAPVAVSLGHSESGGSNNSLPLPLPSGQRPAATGGSLRCGHRQRRRRDAAPEAPWDRAGVSNYGCPL